MSADHKLHYSFGSHSSVYYKIFYKKDQPNNLPLLYVFLNEKNSKNDLIFINSNI